MAWTRWHHQMAGAGLLLATGCMTPPSAPNNKIMTPPAQFPSAPTAKQPPANSPAPNMPPISNSSGMRIGPATGQGTAANASPARLQSYDPSTQAPVSSGQRIASTPAISASTPATTLPNMMPNSNPSFPQMGTNAPPTWATPNLPATTSANVTPPSMPVVAMPAAPNLPDNFAPTTMPPGNIQPPPNLSIPGPVRSTYPGGSVNP